MKASLFFLCNAQISDEIKQARSTLQQLKKSAKILKKKKAIYQQLVAKMDSKKQVGNLPQNIVKVNKFQLNVISFISVIIWTLNLFCFD